MAGVISRIPPELAHHPAVSPIHITLDVAEQSIQKKMVVYDKDGQQHFDALSAFQKSMRGSDPDAALYWLAKMLHAGEDPRIIARRLCVSASEDVGMANSMALVVATAAWQAVERIGLPEGKHQLAHATVYVATSPKSSSTSVAIESALNDVTSNRTQPMPHHLRDKHSPGIHKAGQGFNYKHPKNHPGHFVAQDYLGVDKIFYNPTEQGAEKQVKELVENWRKEFQAVRRQATEPAATTNIPPGTCSACHHARPFDGSLMCFNGNVMATNPNPEKFLAVKPDHRCDYFEPAT